MNDRKRVKYDIAVMARLCFPMPEPDDTDSDEEPESIWEYRRQFEEDTQLAYDEWVTTEYLEAKGSEPGDLPDPLTNELGRVSVRLRALETYRDRLIVFARTLASEPVPARTLGRCTGLSHSTIVRMVTPEAIADVATEAAPAAAELLGENFDPRDDPELYLRLQFASRSSKGEDQ